MVHDMQDALQEAMQLNQQLIGRCLNLALEVGALKRRVEELEKPQATDSKE